MPEIKLGKNKVGTDYPAYFIADISANHDGEFGRAIELIHLAAEAGADAAKFQNFTAGKIVSDRGFKSLGGQVSHQSKWEKSVFEVYEDASLPQQWTRTLKEECVKVGIDYFSAPYDFEAVDMLDEYMDLYKIGSGDITWVEILTKIASKNKPVLLATGASNIGDVQRAVQTIIKINPQLVLMQCNTNYTGSLDNFHHVHLNVLKTFATMYPNLVLGLSDHTPGHATVLGAIALGARVIEKHFTDDTTRTGPDHPFSMSPTAWRDMVDRSRELEYALGDSNKRISDNEANTVVVQRRCLRARRDIRTGEIITRDMVDVLRPAPQDAIFPYDIDKVIGMCMESDIPQGEYFKWNSLCSNPTHDDE